MQHSVCKVLESHMVAAILQWGTWHKLGCWTSCCEYRGLYARMGL